jgi:hypothetical protein
MPQSKEEVVVALDGSVNIAAADVATLPTDLATLDSDFYDLGYQSSDGVTFSVTPNVENVDAWQSATPIRKIVTARTLTLAFSALQWNVSTFAAAYGGGDWTEPSAGVFRYDPPADEDDLVDYAAVLDFADGDKDYRLVVKQGNITEAVETNLARGGAAVLPITIEAVTPDEDDRSWYLLSNDPALDASS